MSSVKLDASQYSAYDMDGEIVATRAVKVHTLSDLSEEGPGICAVLRTGEETGNRDGIGVSMTITNEQLAELGYVPKGFDEEFLETIFSDFEDDIAQRAIPQSVLDSLVGVATDPLPFSDIETEDYEEREPVKYAFCKARGMIDPATHGKGKDLEVFCGILGRFSVGHPVSLPCVDKTGTKVKYL